jgi:hypothetical protein
MFTFSKNEKQEQALVDKRLAVYESRRKLEIDEVLSDYRRSQKNKAVKELEDSHETLKDHAVAVATRKAEISALDERKASKAREIEQVQTDFDSRGLLRDRAQKAEKEKHDAIIVEKDKHIAHVQASLKVVQEQFSGLLAEAVKSLGKAADKESVTKVVGFGPSSEPKKV